jgi:hypothetical protein
VGVGDGLVPSHAGHVSACGRLLHSASPGQTYGVVVSAHVSSGHVSEHDRGGVLKSDGSPASMPPSSPDAAGEELEPQATSRPAVQSQAERSTADPSSTAILDGMSDEIRREPGLPTIDVQEHGGKRDGARQSMNRRLFMQLLVFGAGSKVDVEAKMLAERLHESRPRIPAVVYADTMDPGSLGVLTWSEEPEHFIQRVRPVLQRHEPTLTPRRDYAMIGRTYATGHEPDLEHALLRRAVENVSNEAYRWHVWYPLRRTGEFARLEPHDQSQILREHAQIGMAYGAQELAHDIRLACHGLDPADNEFVIGLVGRELHPLSHLIQAMRKTRQTSEFIAKMGPFFVGHVLHRVSG